MVNISAEEKEYVFSEFIKSNMYPEMAMSFIVEEDITFSDLFTMQFIADEKYYHDLFKVIESYCVKSHKKDKLGDLLVNVVSKLELTEFTLKKKYDSRNLVIKDYYASVLLNKIFKELSLSLDTFNIGKLIDFISMNEYISTEAFYKILKHNIAIVPTETISDIIQMELMGTDDIIRLLFEKSKYISENELRECFRILYNSRYLLVGVICAMLDFYEIVKSNKLQLRKEYNKHKNAISILREEVIKLVIPELEIEITEFYKEALNIALEEKDIIKSRIFNLYFKYINDRNRYGHILPNYLEYGHEEPLEMMTENDYFKMGFDSIIDTYVEEIVTLDDFSLMIRLINLSRFKLFSSHFVNLMPHILRDNVDLNPSNEEAVRITFDVRTFLFIFDI